MWSLLLAIVTELCWVDVGSRLDGGAGRYADILKIGVDGHPPSYITHEPHRTSSPHDLHLDTGLA